MSTEDEVITSMGRDQLVAEITRRRQETRELRYVVACLLRRQLSSSDEDHVVVLPAHAQQQKPSRVLVEPLPEGKLKLSFERL